MNLGADSHEKSSREMLNFDPLDNAKRITGMDLSDGETAVIGLILFEEMRERKRALLSELCDSRWGMPWQGFQEVLDDTDFEVISSYEIPIDTGCQIFNLQYIIAADCNRKLLLLASGCTLNEKENLNSAVIYGTIDGELPLAGGTRIPVGDTQWAVQYGVEDGLKLKIQELDELGLRFTDWLPGKESSLRSFIGERSVLSTQELAISERAIIASLPDRVREFTGL
jgi:hypothetical protein